MKEPLLLLVDDSPLNLQILGQFLEGTYTTAIAKDGDKALEFIAKRQPDLILLDIMMPEMDGFEVCEKLQTSPATKDIPIIFLTARNETEDIVKGFKLGAVDYITKPFQKEELLARIETHLALRQAQQTLQELNATKDRFFSIMTHDLRAPFTGLLGLTEILIDNIESYSKEKLVHILSMQHDAAKNLFALLENLLTWSRLQRGVMEFRPQIFNLSDVAHQNIELMAPNAEHKQITIENCLGDACVVYGDLEMVNTIVRNLLSNGLKFTRHGGTITIAATQHKGSVEIAIADTGIGINEADCSKLFLIDVQYRRPGTAKERGTGLGLILCKEFIDRHGGAIWVESEVDKGTTFRFTLPKKPEALP